MKQNTADKRAVAQRRRPYIRALFRRNYVNYSCSMLGRFFEALGNLAISWLMQETLDTASGVSGAMGFLQLLALACGVLGLLGLGWVLLYFFLPRFRSQAMSQYRDYAFSQLMKKNIGAFSQEDTSTYVSALSNDASTIELNYINAQFSIVSNLLGFVGAFTMMLYYSPLLTALSALFAMIPMAVSMLVGDRVARVEKAVSDRNASFTATLKDALSGFSVIKSFKAEQQIAGMFSQSNTELEGTKRRRVQILLVIRCCSAFAGCIAQFGVFLVGTWMALKGFAITPGTVLLFLQLMNYVVNPLAEIPELLANRKAALALIDKLALALEAHAVESGREIPAELAHGIELTDLSFSYDGEKEVLTDVDARFDAGKSYAIVGASGCGKSTLLKLLMASHGNYSGQIRYDGVELKDISSGSLYDLVSIVEQNVFVFNASIRDNITMFRAFPKEEVDRAIRLSGLEGLIQEKGEEYLCGENGTGLSGGEKQRISIARSLLRQSPVLLVDEATASLDPETALHVSQSILDLEGMTRIVVTHSLDESLLRRYDRILTLKNGRIAEAGRFEELMEQKGYFYSLFTVSQ